MNFPWDVDLPTPKGPPRWVEGGKNSYFGEGGVGGPQSITYFPSSSSRARNTVFNPPVPKYISCIDLGHLIKYHFPKITFHFFRNSIAFCGFFISQNVETLRKFPNIPNGKPSWLGVLAFRIVKIKFYRLVYCIDLCFKIPFSILNRKLCKNFLIIPFYRRGFTESEINEKFIKFNIDENSAISSEEVE